MEAVSKMPRNKEPMTDEDKIQVLLEAWKRNDQKLVLTRREQITD
jgi:hypothetical protein